MKQYKGIIFNSTTVRCLRGPLEEAVRERHIHTAVVSNHGRTEVGERLFQEEASVDLVVGGYDLNRWGKYRKPLPDLLFVAAAKMNLEPEDLVCVTDCARDEQAAKAAGIDTVPFDAKGMDSLVPLLGVNPVPEAPRDFRGVA